MLRLLMFDTYMSSCPSPYFSFCPFRVVYRLEYLCKGIRQSFSFTYGSRTFLYSLPNRNQMPGPCLTKSLEFELQFDLFVFLLFVYREISCQYY